MPPIPSTSAAAISTSARGAILDRLEAEHFDCLVIGGGITGAGIARAASLRGLRVALLEAHDFASGTSSRSSKLIHGGLRYLAQGDVALVRETALERKEIFRLAPHLAERRWMAVPARSRAGLARLRVGITTYEKLGAVEDADLHHNWSAGELASEEPLLDRDTFKFACAYREYLTDDARLVLANLRAAAAREAAVLNHVRVDRVLCEAGKANGVEASCALAQRRITVRARVIVNAAGPWVDAVRGLEDPDCAPLLQLSKGVHVVLPAERLPIQHMWVLGAADGRSIFAIPRDDVVYVGTTDTHYAPGARVWPEIDSEDVEYLLETLPRHFSIEPVKPEECVAAWAGLRPLISQGGRDPTEVSRRDEILLGPSGVVTIAGGKLTGYRPMAARALEAVEERLGRRSGPAPAEEPLPGGDFDGDLSPLVAALVSEGIGDRAARRLAALYGREAANVVALGSAALWPGADVVSGEVDWAVSNEGAAHVEDVLYRRTRVALYGQGREAAVEPITRRMAELLGWDEASAAEESRSAREQLERDLGFAGSVR